MDVAAVFRHLLELPAFRDRAEKAAGGRLSRRTLARLGAIVFLHDIGKLHPECWFPCTCGDRPSEKEVELVKMRLRDVAPSAETSPLFDKVVHRTDLPRRPDRGPVADYRTHKHTLYGRQEGACGGCSRSGT